MKRPARHRASQDPRVKDLEARIALVEKIRDFVNELNGNVSRASDRLGLRRQQVWGWLEDSILPDLRTVKAVTQRLEKVYKSYKHQGGAS